MDLPTSSDFVKMSVDEFDTTKFLEHAITQRDARRLTEFPIIDVDSHHYETESMGEILDFVDDPVIRHLALSNRQTGQRGSILSSGGRVGHQDMAGRVTRYPLRKLEKTPQDGVHRDVHLALRWMDAMGVDYSIMFPTPMLGFGMHPQAEIEVAMARAYNRWLVAKVLPGSPRIRSMLYLPLNDHNESYRIVKEFGGAPGVIGFMVTSVRHKAVHDNDFMKTYAAIEELGLPIAFHSGPNWDDGLMRHANRFITVHALGFTWYNVFHCTNWVINALPERFPKLKVIWIESGIAWVPWLMLRLDNEYKMRTSEAPGLKKLPSEYMRDMYYATQPMEKPDDPAVLEMMFKMMGAESQLVYSSDYPHWDMDLPSVIYDLPFLTERAKRNILGENARRLFNLDIGDRFPGYRAV